MSHGGDDDLAEEHEEHVNHEAWVIPYADLLTLLMAMFIALWGMSSVDMSKFQQLAKGFSEALGGGKLDAQIGGDGRVTSPVVGAANGAGALEGVTMASEGTVDAAGLAAALNGRETSEQEKQAARQTLEEVQNKIEKSAASLGLSDQIKTRLRNDGLEVTLVTDQVLFQSGDAELQAGGQRILDIVGEVLKGVENPILVNGYTDDQPISSAMYRSNLFLSSARATMVGEYFIGLGIPADRVSPSGKGELDPVDSNLTAEGRARNRRVEVIVQSMLLKRTLDRAGLDTSSADEANSIQSITPDVAGEPPKVGPGLRAD